MHEGYHTLHLAAFGSCKPFPPVYTQFTKPFPDHSTIDPTIKMGCKQDRYAMRSLTTQSQLRQRLRAMFFDLMQ